MCSAGFLIQNACVSLTRVRMTKATHEQEEVDVMKDSDALRIQQAEFNIDARKREQQ
jgi:hypothetical protein